MKEFPVLYHKAKTGTLHQWRVFVEGDVIFTEHGQVDGALQVTPGKRATPKNVGKKNATTAEEQALIEAEAMWRFKLERKYREKPEEAQEQLFLPMLAHPIEKDKSDDYAGFVQPKLDGVRCMASLAEDGSVMLSSRVGKPYLVPHIQEALKPILRGDLVLDGELYCHGLSLQTITSLVKRQQPESVKLGYHVYDVPMFDGNDALEAMDRMKLLGHGRLQDCEPPLFRVPTYSVASKDEVMDWQRKFIEAGYEGAMFRRASGIYEWGYRSRDLLKVKTWQDGEFEVVGYRAGDGAYSDCVVWKVRNDLNDETFDCNHACSMEQKREYLANGDRYIGRKLTIKYFGRTKDGIPTYNTGRAFRADEDMPDVDR